ncbi:MAG: glycoside hydrolase family 25 protein [Actinomycetales bacterium]|nr:glycoside hydrolase family 25 protein [Actinomycetales bacterium]
MLRKFLLSIAILLSASQLPSFAAPSPTPSTTELPTSSASPAPAPAKVKVELLIKPKVIFTGQTYKITGRLIAPSISPSATPTDTPTASPSPSTSATPQAAMAKLQVKSDGVWKTLVTAKVNRRGMWSFTLVAPTERNYLMLRVVHAASFSRAFDIRVLPMPVIAMAGPGGRIGGVDISRYQHSILPINFKQMAKSGVGFAFIKGSDGNSADDSVTRAYVISDSAAAKAAGIYVGYYHFARVPGSNSSPVIIASAQKQARQALARLAELGGYDGKTLPYVLDIESAPRNTAAASITLWTKTWLDTMYTATGRRSIIYSYRYFLSRRFSIDSATVSYLRLHPLWLAHPGDPANPNTIPGEREDGIGCYKSAWTLTDCTATWSFWQYTSRGDREKYGIPWSPKAGSPCPVSVKYCAPEIKQPRLHLDLNVFNGSVIDIANLVQGTWRQVPVEPAASPSPSPTPNPTPSP